MKYIPLKYIKEDPAVGNADSSEDARESTGLLERLVADVRRQLVELSPAAEPLRRADLLLQLGRALVRLEKHPEAWGAAREAFDLYLTDQAWEGAVQACDILFLSEQALSLAALGQGIWLAVTYPVDPELSAAMLQHVVDETPPDADGAAVAAITAHYLADLRAQEPQREHLKQLRQAEARRKTELAQAEDDWLHTSAKIEALRAQSAEAAGETVD